MMMDLSVIMKKRLMLLRWHMGGKMFKPNEDGQIVMEVGTLFDIVYYYENSFIYYVV